MQDSIKEELAGMVSCVGCHMARPTILGDIELKHLAVLHALVKEPGLLGLADGVPHALDYLDPIVSETLHLRDGIAEPNDVVEILHIVIICKCMVNTEKVPNVSERLTTVDHRLVCVQVGLLLALEGVS